MMVKSLEKAPGENNLDITEIKRYITKQVEERMTDLKSTQMNQGPQKSIFGPSQTGSQMGLIAKNGPPPLKNMIFDQPEETIQVHKVQK